MMKRIFGKTRIFTMRGDITEQNTDAIVNAANSSLLGGGGVDGAIHRKGGPSILEECKQIRRTLWPDGLPTGEATITTGGNLKARYVIHTVGPVWNGGQYGEGKALAEAYKNTLSLAVLKGIKTIAFPSISTGAYGYPIERACEIAVKTVKEFVEEQEGLEKVVFVLFSQSDLDIYEKALNLLS